ncbi:hypothetical protein Calkr_0065 [Caldicellulosiruptor acetigenus I77R1B]|uniref:Uncharacterized protein n=1 Tax=Caldicellulosiruptor acetigenus (strain ATCC 700853 / DSM 12137 / I77R1B) TaxID=632335 RepID=E4S5I1_CALA7|nr:SurA N-terminal domain-containing protein [Caldicellulosiruptor acetigenus]ADQ39642.1 hypothetical protein Calkr_0065 [Caldicellulosiruptor acetigenus I77R1B]
MKRSKILIAGICSLAVLIGIVAVGWSLASKKELPKDVVAVVNGHKIYKKDLDMAYSLEELRYENAKVSFEELKKKYGADVAKELEGSLRKKTRQEILDEMIEWLVLYDEAKKEGCEVSLDEAKAYYNKTQKMIQDVLSGKLSTGEMNNTQRAIELINSFVKKQGISEKEHEEMVIKECQMLLSIQKYLQEKEKQYKNKHPNATLVEVGDYLKSLRVNLKKKAEIIVNKNI